MFGGLGQTHHPQVSQAQFFEGLGDHVQLAPAAVHHQQIRQLLPLFAIMARHHFPEHGVVILALHPPDLEAAVAGLIRHPVGKGHQGPHGLLALQGGNVQAFHTAGGIEQMQAVL